MNMRQQLYYLIKQYMLGKYDTQTFADQFGLIYFHADDYTELSDIEDREFMELATIADRTSCYVEDLKNSPPNVYFTADDLRKKTVEVCKKLNIKY